jgi:hypothetical protein
MAARIDPSTAVNGLHAIEMENDWLRLTVLPELGAKIYDLVCKRTGRDVLWHNPRIPPQTYAIESNFDNYWCGGWDEGFPSCDECDHAGEHYPNLGELRSVHWNVASAETARGNAVAELTTFGPISPVRARKTVTLHADQPVLTMQYGLENLGPLPLDFIWGTHPALKPSDRMLLRIPAKTGIVGQSSHPSLGEPGQRYAWPILQTPLGATDISRTQPADAGVSCGHYATDFEAGWYAVEDETTGAGFLLAFPVSTCPYLWMWLSYGGWRGYHHIIIEPWTSYPVNLATAVKQRTAKRLEEGDKLGVEVHATIYASPETWEDALRRLESYGALPGQTASGSVSSCSVTAIIPEKK